MNQEFTLKERDGRRNCFIEEIKQDELISKKHKKFYKILNYTEHLLILASAVTGCVSISAFACSVGILVGIVSYAAKTCVVTAGIKKYKSVIKKKRRNMIT